MNELLAKIKLPGEIVRLPSRGMFYDDGVLSPEVKDGEVEVFPMSAYDEILMRNINDILNGVAVNKVFARCIPQILQPNELFNKDVDLLLMMLHKVTYGGDITITYQHDCADAKSHKYTIQLMDLVKSTKFIDPTVIGEVYTLVLDNGQVVKLHPIKFKDVLTMMQDPKEEGTFDIEFQNKVLNSVSNIILSVDGISDRDKIQEWLKELPAPWFTKIAESFNLTTEWGPTNHSTIKCEDCKKPVLVDVPFNPLTFFLTY